MFLSLHSVSVADLTVTFWYGSGSRDPYFGLADPDSAFFVSDLQDVKKKFFCLIRYLLEGTFTSFKPLSRHKTVGINVFLTIFA